VARWVMRKRPYVGALRREGDHLMLVALRHTDEVVLPSELQVPAGRALDERERKLAEQLVEALADEFDPAAYRDTYRERVQELIEAKSKGRKLKLVKPKVKKAPESLEKALQASLAHTARGGDKTAGGAKSTRPTPPTARGTRTKRTTRAPKPRTQKQRKAS